MTSQYSTPKRKIVILYKILKLKIIFEITIFPRLFSRKTLNVSGNNCITTNP